MHVPPLPAGSKIGVEQDADGLKLRWLPGTGSVGRWGVAAFLGCWLGGWVMGEVFAARQLLVGGLANGDWFLVFWLGMWTIGGIAVIAAFINLIRPRRPDSMCLSAARMRYEPGSQYICGEQNPFQPRKFKDFKEFLSAFGYKLNAVDISREELARFVLDRVGERQRLYFDRGVERIEVGLTLSEPEREWLHAVLEAWRQEA